MFRNYLLSAWRNMKRAGLYSAISIFCLAVGITGAIIVTIYLNHELSYDTHHEHHQRIFFMEGFYDMAGSSFNMAITPFPLALAMQEEFPQVKTYARFFNQHEEAMVGVGEDEYLEKGFYLADSTVFDVFTHHFVYGRAEGALSEPNTAVLTRSISEKYFGLENPVGESIRVGDQHYLVRAVIEDLPDNSHFRYHALLSMSTASQQMVYSLDPELFWNINLNYTYIKLHEGQDIASVQEGMPAFLSKYVEPMGQQFGATSEYTPIPLRQTHFRPLMMGQETGHRTTLLIVGLIALFLVVIAAINYTNLATARAAKRAREIGIRKVTGASRQQLLVQFLSESVLVAFVSLLFSLLLVELLLPYFNTLTANSFKLSNILQWELLLQVLAITLLTGLAAGAYPAFILSRMNPSLIVKGFVFRQKGSAILRKVLVVFQFAISIMLVTATLTVQRQLDFLQDKPLGFDQEDKAVVTLHGEGPLRGIGALEQVLLQNPLVKGTTKCFSVPGREHNMYAVRIETDEGVRESAITANYVDPDFLREMNIRLLQGRAFDPDMRSDAGQSILVNESTTRQFGWTENPIGRRIYMNFDQEGNPATTYRVIGVVEDFHFQNLNNPIEPMMLILPDGGIRYRHIVVSYDAVSQEEVLAFIEQSAREHDPSRLPEISSLDSSFREAFRAEERLSTIFGFFAVVTIVISFLGLFGLSSFMVEQRKKEIGIRKVLGSSSLSVLSMLYREFSYLVLIAVVLAAPLSWYLLDRWLQGFLYHIDMPLAPVILSALIAYGLAIATVSYHSLKASALNPVDSIRAE